LWQRGARPHAPLPRPPWPLRQGCVALLLSGVRYAGTVRKPEVAAEDGDSLGARLRRRRRELGIRRVDAATHLGASWKSLMWWERDNRLPIVSAYPGIIAFLGYEPWPEPCSLAEALLAERRRRGLETCKAAALIGVDEGTWSRWERAEWKPTRRTVLALNRLFGLSVQIEFPADVR
ncbi:MAG: helix-turn-helix transcriptional regulator, partial [Phenylobacterium sp.]